VKFRKVALGALLVLVGVPILGIAIATAAYYAYFYESERANATLVSGGHEREYLLHVPKTYDAKKPTALVVSLHGASAWPGTQRRISGWNRVADEHGFIVVYPSGTTVTGSGEGAGIAPKAWLLSKAGLAADVKFIGELIDKVRAGHNIDPARIYVEGFSNGGGMAFALSCAMPERIAAVGMVAAAQSLPWKWCTDTHPVPMVAFHGVEDNVAPYKGGNSWMSPLPFPDQGTWVASWAQRNRCAGSPTESRVRPDVTRIEYANCAENASVVLYRVDAGHSWPGSEPMPEWFVGRTTRSIDATRELWAFFERHRRP
jgi:polyhydroxybutyrate depolymerase